MIENKQKGLHPGELYRIAGGVLHGYKFGIFRRFIFTKIKITVFKVLHVDT